MANDTHTLKIGSTTYDLAAKTWYPSAVITTDFDSQSNITAGFNVETKNSLHMPSTDFGSMNGCGAFMQFGNNSWKCQLAVGNRGYDYLRQNNASQKTPEGLYFRKYGESTQSGAYTWTPWREIVSIDNTGTMKITHLDSTYHYSGGPTSKSQTLKIPYATTFSGGITGNVTGNCSGSSGSCTGNAATASSVAWTGVTGRPTNLSQFTNDSGFISGSPLSLEMMGTSGTKTPFIDFHYYGGHNDYDYRIICTSGVSSSVGAGTATFTGTSNFAGNITANSNGSFSIGADTKRFKSGYFSTSVYATSGFYEQSDERLKDFTNPIKVDLDKLSKLTKSYFYWKNDRAKLNIGVSAQEIKEIYPEIVEETESGYLNVSYDKLSVIALTAVDELHKKNKELEERIQKLESIVNELIK